MKKVTSILLVLLYAASFLGMLWSKDCRESKVLSASVYAFEHLCTTNASHASTGSEEHPLYQFCKLVEIHKTVTVAKQQRIASLVFNTFQRSYPPLTILHTKELKLINSVTLLTSNTLYLHNRVLLI